MVEQLDLFDVAYQESLEAQQKLTEQDLQEMHDKKYKEHKLTPRQWRLLDLIKHNSFEEHRKTTQKEVCDKLAEHGYVWKETSGENHDHCTAVWQDIAAINLSYETDKLIISDNYEYWIGDAEETMAFLDDLWKKLSPRLVRYWAFLKKVERDGQCLIFDRKGQAIDEDSQARAFIESYGKERISK